MQGLWRWLRSEPIVHFTVMGAALFALHALVTPAGPDAHEEASSQQRVEIGASRIAGLVESWSQAWGRPPTASELDELIEEEVRGEVLAREAMARGLDRDDEFIRQHLRERMEVMADAGALTVEPTEAELRSFYETSKARFGGGPIVSFAQVPLAPAELGGSLDQAAAGLLARLNAGPGADLTQLGGSTDLPREFTEMAEADVAGLFGPEFAMKLRDLPTGTWTGPIASSQGQHLVRLDAWREEAGPPFEDVRESVREAWLADRAEARREQFYQELRRHYAIVIERPAPEPAAGRP